jgi:tRNA pseudouridine55 synthase
MYFVPSVIPDLIGDLSDYPEGIVLAVDKPYRWTSADVIRKLKYAAIRHFQKKNLKVGHAGTLDPLATGVLLVCIGPACKRAQELQDHDKEYIARIRFGATTPSYDLEKDVDRTFPYEHISRADVEAALPAFLGDQEQVAPLFSAKSIDGVRAYELARKLYRSGRVSELDDAALETLHRSKINISELELLDFLPAGSSSQNPTQEVSGTASSRINVADTSALGLPEAVIRIACSKGTYIRAFARDLGEALGSGAHLCGLIRSRSGSFRVEDALSVDAALALLQPGN